MRFQIEETITYVIEADDEEDARAKWLDLPTPQVELPGGIAGEGVIYTETLGLTAVTAI